MLDSLKSPQGTELGAASFIYNSESYYLIGVGYDRVQ
jgi:hypothetical protein